MTLPVVNLRARSSYSRNNVALAANVAKTLPKLAAKADQPAMGLIDLNTLAGAYEFSSTARKEGVQPIVGVDFTTDEGLITLIAENGTGWTNLLKITRAQHSGPLLGVTLDEVIEHAEGLVMLAGAPKSALDVQLAAGRRQANDWIKRVIAAFPDSLFLEVDRTEGRRPSEATLDRISRAYSLPMVATSPIAYAKPKDYELLELLAAIDQRRIVDDANLVRPEKGQHFKSTDEMRELFADAPQLLENAALLALRCTEESVPKFHKPMLPHYPDAKGRENETMREQAIEGYEKRLLKVDPERHDEYRARLARELDVICTQGFSGYFLIVADFINWSKRQDIPVGPGRGSGAGSAVAWALGITDVDPIRWGLLFERFINPDRVSLPDFDVDFCQSRRGETIEYVRQKYGAEKVVAIGTANAWKTRSAFKDAARALGIPNGAAHAASQLIPDGPKFPKYVLSETNPEAPGYLDPEVRAYFRRDPQLERALVMGEPLQGLVRQHSRHAAGIIIADPDIGDVVPVMRDPKHHDLVTQFDMKAVEDCGLVKFDFLGLKTTTIINEAVHSIRETVPELKDLDILDIPFEDEGIFEMLNKGDCHGIFQLEEDGMVRTLKQVRPTAFEDLVAIISLYRPGPMDNIPAYANRKNGAEPIQVPHPKLKELLSETQGIMVYQEQVMKAAQILAGYTLGGADILRRAMGKKIQAEMDSQRKIFVEGCGKTSRIAPARANELFDLIDKFAGYGFNKSHAAAYALLTWQGAWLKLHHPAAFYAASMTYNDDDFDKLRKLVREARERGIEMLPPSIEHSMHQFKPEVMPDGKTGIRWGLGSIKGVGAYARAVTGGCRGKNLSRIEDVAKALSHHGNATGPIRGLAEVGAFDHINKNRRAVAEHLIQCVKFETGQSGQNLLFSLDSPPCPVVQDMTAEEKRAQEIELLCISFHEHPLASAHSETRRLSAVSIAKVDEFAGCGAVTVLARVEGVSKSPRNANSYARISDATGEIECVVDGTLSVGDIIVGEVARKANEPRWRLVQHRPFVRAETPRRMRIDIKASHDWEKLRRQLVSTGRGSDRIDVMIDLGEKKARRVLSPCFVITPDLEKELAANPDVISVRTF